MEPNSGRWRSSKRYGDVGCNVYQQFDPVGSQKVPVPNWRVSTPPNITMEQVSSSYHVLLHAWKSGQHSLTNYPGT